MKVMIDTVSVNARRIDGDLKEFCLGSLSPLQILMKKGTWSEKWLLKKEPQKKQVSVPVRMKYKLSNSFETLPFLTRPLSEYLMRMNLQNRS